MDNNSFIEMNRQGWDELVKSDKPFSNTILPEYGPFLKRNEEEIGLFKDLQNAKVLDLGCGEGKSLEYLYKNGASDVWGIDISQEQIANARKILPQFKNNFLISPMEEEANVPNNYFDYVISIFSIGYTSDISKTLKNAYNYLSCNGSLIISWTHPFYYCLDVMDSNVVVSKSYFNEDSEVIIKGVAKINLAQKNLMISTMIQEAKKAGFYVDEILEEETTFNGYESDFWRTEKTIVCPSTIIYKFKKIDKN